MNHPDGRLIVGLWLIIMLTVVGFAGFLFLSRSNSQVKRRVFRWYIGVGGALILLWFWVIGGPIALLFRDTVVCDIRFYQPENHSILRFMRSNADESIHPSSILPTLRRRSGRSGQEALRESRQRVVSRVAKAHRKRRLGRATIHPLPAATS